MPNTFTKNFRLSSSLGVRSSTCAKWARSIHGSGCIGKILPYEPIQDDFPVRAFGHNGGCKSLRRREFADRVVPRSAQQRRGLTRRQRHVETVERQRQSESPGLDVRFFAGPAAEERLGLLLHRQSAQL